MPDVSLSGIEFTIKGSSDNASASIDKLIGKLSQLNAALGKTADVNKAANGLKKLKAAISDLSSADLKSVTEKLKKFGTLSKDLEGLSNVSKDIASFARAMSKLAENPEGLGDVAQMLNLIGQVDLSNLANAAEAMRAFADAMKALSKGGGSPQGQAVSAVFETIKRSLEGIWNAAKKVGKVLAAPFKNAFSSVKGFAKGIGGVLSGLKRIAMYRIFRTIIKAITQAFQEGVKNLYNWSRAVGGAEMSGKTFAQTMDGLASSSAYFKNSIGAAVAPLISALAPAIDFVIDKVVALINVINQLLALLGGASSWNRAIRKTEEYGDAIGGAGGAAKEALRYLAPFDELNRLPDANKGGGGGGGSNAEGMFEETTEFLDGLKDFTDALKAAVEAGDWQGVGTLLGEKVNEILDKIDFAGMGAKVGRFINAWFTTKYWTLDTINFNNIGAKIATFLNNTLEQIDFETVGRTITQWPAKIGDLIIGAFETADWKLIGKSIGDFFRGAIGEATDWLNSYNWEEMGEKIAQGIKDFFDGADTSALAQSIKAFISAAWNAAVGLLTGVIKGFFGGSATVNSKVYFKVSSVSFDSSVSDSAAFGNGIAAALGIAAGGLIGFKYLGVGGAILGATIGLALTLRTGDVLFEDPVSGKTREAIEAYIAGLDEAFKGAKPGTYEYQYYQHFRSYAEEEMNGAGKSAGEAFFEGLKEAFGGTTTHESPSGETFGGSNGSFGGESSDGGVAKIPATIVVNDIKDNVPSTKKVIDGATAKANKFNPDYNASGMSQAKRTITAIGLIKTAKKDYNAPNMSQENRTITAIGNIATARQDYNAAGMQAKYRTITAIGEMKTARQDYNATGMSAKYRTITSIANMASAKDSLTAAMKQFSTEARFKKSYDGLTVGMKQFSTEARFKKAYDGLTEGMKQFHTQANFNAAKNGLTADDTTFSSNALFNKYTVSKDIADGVNMRINTTAVITKTKGNVSGNLTLTASALGGVLKNGIWSSIPQYASGTTRAGSLFIAGEAGPEVVGHIGGRTEVLNRSQLAATMYAAVRSAMVGTSFRMASAPSPNYSDEDGMNEDVLYRAFSRALADSDLGGDIQLDGNTLYRAMVNRNRQNTRLTGVNAMA